MSIIGLEMQQMKLLAILRDAAEAEEKLNREREKAELSPAPRSFYLREEYESALAAAAPKATPPERKYWWGKLGQDQPPADEGFDADAAYARFKDSLPPPKTRYDEGFNDGLALGFLGFDARCIAANKREVARRERHYASPEGRAEAAWCAMLDTANRLMADKGEVEPPAPAPAAPVVVQASAAEILRAYGIAKGTVVEMPTDPKARQVLVARRRGEQDKPL